MVIAAITSCTNTSNPSVMLAAGLLARNAVKRGVKVKPWVKTSLAPGSQVVSDYYAAAGLQHDLDALGFSLAGYGCTTCIGNSGPLPDPIAEAIEEGDLVAAAVLSGNRNFEGRIHPLVRANYLASPPLVVAYAIAGSMNVDVDARSDRAPTATASPSICATSGPATARSPTTVAKGGRRADVPQALCQRVRGAGRVEEGEAPHAARPSRGIWARHISPTRPISTTCRRSRRCALRHRHGARAGDARRQHHHRPHLARGLDQEGIAGRRISARAPGAAGRVQFLWRAARPSRGDGARHLRQYPHQERDGAGHRGRHDQAHARRQGHADLRRGDAVPAGRRAARHHRRQGIRHRLVARLGGQGHEAPGRQAR